MSRQDKKGEASTQPDYTVGYKKPPKSGQFKAGQSGNPKGRPKRSKNMNTLLNLELDKTVIVNEQGRRYELSKREAIVKRMINDAASGNMNAIKTLIGFLGTDPEVDPKELISDDDVDVLARFTDKVLKGRKNGK